MQFPMQSPPVQAVLLDLLMAVMDSLAVWAAAAGDRERGLTWRDAVTARMRTSRTYMPYEELVAAEAQRLGFDAHAPARLFDRWQAMEPWADAARIAELRLPYGFLSNCSTSLARVAAERTQLHPRFVLSAEEVGVYKPAARAYLEGCRRLHAAPGATLFVAGSAYDAEGAEAAGLRAVRVHRRADAVAKPSVAVVASLADALTGV